MAKKQNLEEVARYADMLSAMGMEPRLRIMQLLLSAHPQGLVVGDIGGELEIPSSTLSHHLEKLKNEGLVKVRRDGTFLWYSADTPPPKRPHRWRRSSCSSTSRASPPLCTSASPIDPTCTIDLVSSELAASSPTPSPGSTAVASPDSPVVLQTGPRSSPPARRRRHRARRHHRRLPRAAAAGWSGAPSPPRARSAPRPSASGSTSPPSGAGYPGRLRPRPPSGAGHVTPACGLATPRRSLGRPRASASPTRSPAASAPRPKACASPSARSALPPV